MSARARRLVDATLAAAGRRWPSVAREAGGRLLRQRRLDEAEALMSAAAEAFPRHAGVRARHALAAEAQGRFAEAARRWRLVTELRPDHAVAWRSLASCLRLTADIPGAADAVARAAALRPDDWTVLLEQARILDRAERHGEAAAVWARVIRHRPTDPLCIQGYADCLIRLDRLDEAARQIAVGLRRHPEHRSLVAALGLLAIRRQDWDEALAIWSRYAAAYPDDHSGRDFLARVAGVRQFETEAQGETPPTLLPVNIEVVQDEAVRARVLRFESIGIDCEFGLVQRRYGAEPLGLLRWADVTVPTLVAALDARFVDMGAPETTELVVMDSFFFVRDRRWGLSMNTFLFVREVAPDILYPKMCRRVAYLCDKFVTDLGAAEKVLVFKSDAVDLAELRALHRALRAYGPVRLLNVRRDRAPPLAGQPLDLAPGEAVRLEPDLYVGLVSRFGNEGPVWDVAYDEWVSICTALGDDVARPVPALGDAVTA